MSGVSPSCVCLHYFNFTCAPMSSAYIKTFRTLNKIPKEKRRHLAICSITNENSIKYHRMSSSNEFIRPFKFLFRKQICFFSSFIRVPVLDERHCCAMTAMAQWITQNFLGSFLLRRSLLLLLFISSFVFLWSLALWDTHTERNEFLWFVMLCLFVMIGFIVCTIHVDTTHESFYWQQCERFHRMVLPHIGVFRKLFTYARAYGRLLIDVVEWNVSSEHIAQNKKQRKEKRKMLHEWEGERTRNENGFVTKRHRLPWHRNAPMLMSGVRVLYEQIVNSPWSMCVCI